MRARSLLCVLALLSGCSLVLDPANFFGDAGPDGSVDASEDAPLDVLSDTPTDRPSDVSADAGDDATVDAPIDVPADAPIPPTGCEGTCAFFLPGFELTSSGDATSAGFDLDDVVSEGGEGCHEVEDRVGDAGRTGVDNALIRLAEATRPFGDLRAALEQASLRGRNDFLVRFLGVDGPSDTRVQVQLYQLPPSALPSGPVRDDITVQLPPFAPLMTFETALRGGAFEVTPDAAIPGAPMTIRLDQPNEAGFTLDDFHMSGRLVEGALVDFQVGGSLDVDALERTLCRTHDATVYADCEENIARSFLRGFADLRPTSGNRCLSISSGFRSMPRSVQVLDGTCGSPGACEDDDPCTTDRCSSGACEHIPAPWDTPCTLRNTNPGICIAGQCSPQTCVRASDCISDQGCAVGDCVEGSCIYAPLAERSSCGADFACLDSACEMECRSNADCDDLLDCTEDRCSAQGTCSHLPLEGGTCGAGGTCRRGVCSGVGDSDCQGVGQRLTRCDAPETFADARARCRRLGGRPASIRYQSEAAAVRALIDRDSYWIGLQDAVPGGPRTINAGFRFQDGETMVYSDWAPGEPDDADACGWTAADGRFRSAPCDHLHRVICELGPSGG